MTNPACHRSRSQGFTLIEVMIAVLVLATGFLALTALQGALIRSSADAKARSQIASYAASEMDRLRLGGISAIVDVPAVGLADVGATDPLALAADAAALGDLNRTIEVTQYVANAAGQFLENAGSPGDSAYFKRVTITMDWTDATGGDRSLRMQTDVSPLALDASKVLVDRPPPEDQGLRPPVRRPSPVTEGMIPIATGGGDDQSTAATNPKPKLVGGESGTYVSDTRFDILTYSTDAYTPPGFVRFDKRIETAIIGCTCQNDTDGFQGDDFLVFQGSKAFRPTFWNGTTYEDPSIAVSAVTTSPAAVSQSVLCDVCCRDHKDPVSESGPKFSPWSGQDSAHYRADLVAVGAGENYQEACRVIRVNGSFRVAADPKIQDTALVATRDSPPTDSSGSQLAGVSNNTSAISPLIQVPVEFPYVDYVYAYIKKVFSDRISNPNPYDPVAVDAKGIQQAKGLNVPTYVPILPAPVPPATGAWDVRWMHGRAIMADYLEPDAVDRIEQAKASTSSPLCTSSDEQELAQCVLPHAPVATINTTELARWVPRAFNTATDAVPASLAALNLPSSYYNFAQSKLVGYNSGLALVSPVSTNDGNVTSFDEQLVLQLSSTQPPTTPWLYVPSPNPSTARNFGDPTNPMRGYASAKAPEIFSLTWSFTTGNPGSPVADSNKGNDPSAATGNNALCNPGTAGNNSNPYTCPSFGTNNIPLALAGYNRIELDTNFSNPCGAGKVSKPQCVVYTFSGATVGTPAASIVSTNYTLADSTRAGKLDEKGTLVIPGITPSGNSSVTVNFTRSLPATTHTCSGTTPTWIVPCDD